MKIIGENSMVAYTKELAAWAASVRYTDIPAPVIDMMKKCLNTMNEASYLRKVTGKI